jgi:hypothetical protein
MMTGMNLPDDDMNSSSASAPRGRGLLQDSIVSR